MSKPNPTGKRNKTQGRLHTPGVKPITLYVVERCGHALTLHAIPVIRESTLSYYVADHNRRFFGWRMQVPKAKAHRSMKAAWTQCRDELLGSIAYYQSGIATLEALLQQIPPKIGVPRHPRKVAA